MTESRKLAAILVTDIVGYSRLAGADEDRILARLRTLRSDLIEPTISVHRGRVVKGTGEHPVGDLFGSDLEQKVQAHAMVSCCNVQIRAVPTAKSRTRLMTPTRSVTEMAPRASRRLKSCEHLSTWS